MILDVDKKYPEKTPLQLSNKKLQFKRRHKFSFQQWEIICARYFYVCVCCKETFSAWDLTVDHVKPRFIDGDDEDLNDLKNFQPLCLGCNQKKATKEIDYRWDKGEGLMGAIKWGIEIISRSYQIDFLESIGLTQNYDSHFSSNGHQLEQRPLWQEESL